MGMSVGDIFLDLNVNKKEFRKEIDNVGNYAQNSLGKSFAGVGKVLAGVVAGIGIAKFTKDCIRLGSNLAEVQNVVDVTFGNMSKYIDDFADNQALSFGLSETSAKQYTGVLGSMLKSMGLGTSQAKDMSIEMTKLAGDMASFYNLDTDLAFEKIRAGISGETEPLKQLGINMSVANLEAYAMSQGITQAYQKMDQASQALLRYNYLMSTTADAQGDFARTGDGWANTVRMMRLQWDSFKASMGQIIIAVLLPIAQMLNKLLGYINIVTKSFARMIATLTGKKVTSSTTDISNGMGNIASGAGGASDAIGGVADATKDATKEAKKAQKAFSGLLGIDEANIISKDSSDSGSSGSSGGGGADTGPVTDNTVTETIEDEMAASSKFLDFFKPLSDSWAKYGPGIVSNFKSAWDNIVSIATSAGSIISSNWDAWFQAFSDSIMSFGSVFSIAINGVTILFRSAWDNGGAYLFDQMIKLWTNLLRLGTVITDNFVAPFLEGINKSIMPAIGNLIGLGLTKIADAVAWLNTQISGFVDNFRMDKASDSIMSFKGIFTNSFNEVIGIVGGVVAAIGTFKLISTNFAFITKITLSIANGFKWVGAAASTMFSAISSGGGIMAGLSTVFSGVGQSLIGLLNPVTLIIAAIAGLVAGFVYLYTTSSTFRDQINEIFMSIFTNIAGIITGLINIIKTIYDLGIKPVVDSTMIAFDSLWNNGLATLIQNVSVFALQFIDMILGIWNNAINPLVNLILTILLPVVSSVWKAILAVVTPIIEKIMSYVNMFMNVLNVLMALLNEHVWPLFKTVFDGLSEIIQEFWKFIEPIFNWFMELLGYVVTFVLDFFLAPLDAAFQLVVAVIKDIVDPISKVFDGVKQLFQGVIDFVIGTFTGDWSRAMGGIKKIFSGVWNSLVGIVETVWGTILSLFGNAGSIFSGVVDGIADVFKNIVNCIIDGLNKVIALPFNKINGLLNDIRETSFLGVTPFDFIPHNALPVPQIPKLARGGIIDAPTLAMVGEAGKEAVMPLENNTGWIDDLSSKIASRIGGGGGSSDPTIVELLEKIAYLLETLNLVADFDIDGFIRLIDKRKARLGNPIVR